MLIHSGSILEPEKIKEFTFTEDMYKNYFDGSDLSNWVIKTRRGEKKGTIVSEVNNNDNIWWSIVDGNLRVKSGPDKEGSTLWTKDEFSNFRVRLKFKFVDGNIDSGIFMRGSDEFNPQIQIGVSGSLKRDMTGSPYVPKKGYPKEALKVAEILKTEGWNHMEAEAFGDRYRVWFNGVFVMDYKLEEANIQGPVGIQLHSNRNMEILYKDIDIAHY
jgi:hypothetical protein